MDTKGLSCGVIYSNMPEGYERPESDRPRSSEVSECENIPVIDLASPNRAQTVQQVGDACKYYGFFQVINHGVSTEGVEKMVGVSNEFFNLPVEEKLKLYSDDPSKTMRLSTSFNVNKEKVYNWRDYLRLHCYPLDKYVPEWPSNPSSFRDTVSNYCREVRELGYRLEELISESLGLEKDYIKSTFGEQGQHMAVNFYPPCPQPELTYGLPGHMDPNALTILLQDLGVAGLQVLKDGEWVSVNPHPNAFVINIGDQLKALCNGICKSVWHRAITNTEKAGLSVASFLCLQDDAQTSQAKALTEYGSAAIFRGYTYTECYKKFWTRDLEKDHCLVDIHFPQSDIQHSPEPATTQPAATATAQPAATATAQPAATNTEISVMEQVGEEELPVEASIESSGTQRLASLAQLSVLLRSLARSSVLLSRIISSVESLDDFALVCPQVSVVKEFLLPKLLAIKTIVDFIVLVLEWIENVS